MVPTWSAWSLQVPTQFLVTGPYLVHSLSLHGPYLALLFIYFVLLKEEGEAPLWSCMTGKVFDYNSAKNYFFAKSL